jgi:hypothetical protein
VDGEEGYVSELVTLHLDVAALLDDWPHSREHPPVSTGPVSYVFHGGPGFYDQLDNHETAAHYLARPRRIDDSVAVP